MSPKIAKVFECKKCQYICSKQSDFNKHLTTAKHNASVELNDLEQNVAKTRQYICKHCNKIYEARNSLWYHEQKCIVNNNIVISEETSHKTDSLVEYLMKENKEIKQMIIELAKKDSYSNCNNTTTHTNSHNKAFNLNFFLNETCKEAMNIGDFVDSLKMELSDLERVGEKGYIEGITSIIVKNLKALDITKRPVHCTDKKRETIYIKDADKWEKDEDKSHMHKLIKRVVSKNIKLFSKFKEKHPDCMTYHSKFGDQYHKIVYESMGGKGDNDFEKNEKIIKNVLKEVVVDKTC